MPNPPVRIALTGAAGQIGYAALFRIAAGEMLGRDRPVILQLLERDNPRSRNALKGVLMELEDCAFPLLHDVIVSDRAETVFRDVDAALLIGARPRGPGMERADLLEANAAIFKAQGAALDAVAKRDVKVLVVGNPCNTNAWIAARCAPSLSPRNFTALLRLDQHRAIAQIAAHTHTPVTDIEHVAVWGNHSPTMVTDIDHALAAGRPVSTLCEASWVDAELRPNVARRGSAIIAARGASSAASAAAAAIEHMRDWCLGSNGRWVTMGVASEGEYGIPAGLVCGMPCLCENGDWRVVSGLDLSEGVRAKLDKSVAELLAERDAVAGQLF